MKLYTTAALINDHFSKSIWSGYLKFVLNFFHTQLWFRPLTMISENLRVISDTFCEFITGKNIDCERELYSTEITCYHSWFQAYKLTARAPMLDSLYYILNITAANNPSMQGAPTSAVMVLTLLAPNIPVSVQGLTGWHKYPYCGTKLGSSLAWDYDLSPNGTKPLPKQFYHHHGGLVVFKRVQYKRCSRCQSHESSNYKLYVLVYATHV